MNLQTGKIFFRAGAFLVFLWLPGLSAAQPSIVLTGNVHNEVGKPVAHAHVEARNPKTGQSVSATSGSDGSYSLSGLAPGTYIVTATASGFAERQVEVTLTGSGKPTLNLSMARGRQLPSAPAPQSPTPSLPSLEDLGFSPQQTQANPQLQARLDKRTQMLKMHQKLGLITAAPMVADLITGPMAKAKGRNGEPITEPTQANLDLHAALGSSTAALYGATAYFAIFAPKVPGVHKRGAIRMHEWLAFVHGPGMIATPILGAMAFKQEQDGEKVHGAASYHGTAATVTVLAYGASIVAVAWPIHLKFWEKK